MRAGNDGTSSNVTLVVQPPMCSLVSRTRSRNTRIQCRRLARALSCHYGRSIRNKTQWSPGKVTVRHKFNAQSLDSPIIALSEVCPLRCSCPGLVDVQQLTFHSVIIRHFTNCTSPVTPRFQKRVLRTRRSCSGSCACHQWRRRSLIAVSLTIESGE